MKKIISIMLATLILLAPLSGMAINIPGYEGGIQNERTYKEVIFVTGQPITMEGSLSIKTKAKDNLVTESYTYKLENKALEAKLSRTITLKNLLEPNGSQVKSTKTLDKYKESITIGKDKYEVKDNGYQWSQGGIEDNQPLIDYYSGHYSARKTYDVNKGDGEIVVESLGNLVGYNGPWSATEAQTVYYAMDWIDKTGKGQDYEGTATVEASYNKTKDFVYEKNIPTQISYSGGYIVTEIEENILKYQYDLPKFNGGVQEETPPGNEEEDQDSDEEKEEEEKKKKSKYRNQGSNSLYLDTSPIIQSLNIPAVRDVMGHQYQDELLLMASMEGLPLKSQLIGPSSEMSRGDFARIIIKAMDIPIVKVEQKKSRGRKKAEPVERLFKDVKESHRNFDYIEEAAKRNIMLGVEKPNFGPDKALTRMEAFTIAVRILGLENLAPIKEYSLGFKDENSVQAWARDSIYLAKELGFIEEGDYLYPNRALTKGEAAKLMVDVIEYMQEDLRYDYREGILND